MWVGREQIQDSTVFDSFLEVYISVGAPPRLLRTVAGIAELITPLLPRHPHWGSAGSCHHPQPIWMCKPLSGHSWSICPHRSPGSCFLWQIRGWTVTGISFGGGANSNLSSVHGCSYSWIFGNMLPLKPDLSVQCSSKVQKLGRVEEEARQVLFPEAALLKRLSLLCREGN